MATGTTDTDHEKLFSRDFHSSSRVVMVSQVFSALSIRLTHVFFYIVRRICTVAIQQAEVAVYTKSSSRHIQINAKYMYIIQGKSRGGTTAVILFTRTRICDVFITFRSLPTQVDACLTRRLLTGILCRHVFVCVHVHLLIAAPLVLASFFVGWLVLCATYNMAARPRTTLLLLQHTDL